MFVVSLQTERQRGFPLFTIRNGFIASKGMKKCYNSGKISGLPYLTAYNNFVSADKEIELRGYLPVNPMKKRWPKPSAPWWLHMVVDVWMMIGCDTVFFQRNWSDSRGAQIEFQVALALNKEMIYQK